MKTFRHLFWPIKNVSYFISANQNSEQIGLSQSATKTPRPLKLVDRWLHHGCVARLVCEMVSCVEFALFHLLLRSKVWNKHNYSAVTLFPVCLKVFSFSIGAAISSQRNHLISRLAIATRSPHPPRTYTHIERDRRNHILNKSNLMI